MYARVKVCLRLFWFMLLFNYTQMHLIYFQKKKSVYSEDKDKFL